MWKRFIAMLAITGVLLGSVAFYYDRHGRRTDGIYYAATQIRPDARLLTVGGQAVTAEEYFYWLDSVCQYLVSYSGTQPDFSAPLTEEMTLGQYAKADVVNTLRLYSAVRQMAREEGITLTAENVAALDAQRAQYVSYYGSEESYQQQLQLLGVTDEMLRSIESVPFLYEQLFAAYTDRDSRLYPGEETLQTYGQENGYVTAQLLYFPTAGLDEKPLADMKAKAQDYAAQLSAADDKAALYASLAASLGITASEAGLTFNAQDGDAALHQAVSALAPGQVSAVVEGGSGYYVAWRLDTDYSALSQELFNLHLQNRQDSAKVEYNDTLYDRIDAGAFYTALNTARNAMAMALAGL